MAADAVDVERRPRDVDQLGGMMQMQTDHGMDQALLLRLAARYIWWKKPDEAACYPDRVIAQVMKIGDFDDVLVLVAAAGEDRLREVVRHAEAGQFDERSWAYWHYRLGLAELEHVPALPARRFQ